MNLIIVSFPCQLYLITSIATCAVHALFPSVGFPSLFLWLRLLELMWVCFYLLLPCSTCLKFLLLLSTRKTARGERYRNRFHFLNLSLQNPLIQTACFYHVWMTGESEQQLQGISLEKRVESEKKISFCDLFIDFCCVFVYIVCLFLYIAHSCQLDVLVFCFILSQLFGALFLLLLARLTWWFICKHLESHGSIYCN